MMSNWDDEYSAGRFLLITSNLPQVTCGGASYLFPWKGYPPESPCTVQGRPAMMPDWDKDFNAGRTLLTMNNLPVFEAPIHLEGGSIHSDGQGTMVVTEECLLDPSRNPDLGKEGIEKVEIAKSGHPFSFAVVMSIWPADEQRVLIWADGHCPAVVYKLRLFTVSRLGPMLHQPAHFRDM